MTRSDAPDEESRVETNDFTRPYPKVWIADSEAATKEAEQWAQNCLYECKICNKFGPTKSRAEFLTHLATAHDKMTANDYVARFRCLESLQSTYKCLLCQEKITWDVDDLSLHMSSQHGMSLTRYHLNFRMDTSKWINSDGKAPYAKVPICELEKQGSEWVKEVVAVEKDRGTVSMPCQICQDVFPIAGSAETKVDPVSLHLTASHRGVGLVDYFSRFIKPWLEAARIRLEEEIVNWSNK